MRPSTLRIPLQGGKTLAHRLVKASQNPSFLSGKKTGLHCSHKLIGLRFKAPNVDFVVVISKDLAHPWIGGHNFLRWLTSSKNKNLVEPFRRKTKHASVLFALQILTSLSWRCRPETENPDPFLERKCRARSLPPEE